MMGNQGGDARAAQQAAQEWLQLFVAVLHAAGGKITLTPVDLDLPDGTTVHRRDLPDGSVQFKIEPPGEGNGKS